MEILIHFGLYSQSGLQYNGAPNVNPPFPWKSRRRWLLLALPGIFWSRLDWPKVFRTMTARPFSLFILPHTPH